METIFMNTENSKTNESNKFIYQFTDKLNLKTPNNKNIGLVNLSIYYTWKNIKSEYNNNKFKISAPTWNDELDLPDDSYSISDIKNLFITLNLSSKKTKLLLKILPYKLTPIKSKTELISK